MMEIKRLFFGQQDTTMALGDGCARRPKTAQP